MFKKKYEKHHSDRNKWKIVSGFLSLWQVSVKYNTLQESDLLIGHHHNGSRSQKHDIITHTLHFLYKTKNTPEITTERITSDRIPLFTHNSKV